MRMDFGDEFENWVVRDLVVGPVETSVCPAKLVVLDSMLVTALENPKLD